LQIGRPAQQCTGRSLVKVGEAERHAGAAQNQLLAAQAVGGIYAPTILPILSVPSYLAYEHKMGIEQQRFENQAQGVLPQPYADMFRWREIAQTVATYYHTLSPDGQSRTAIFANNYGDAGAIDFSDPRYGLPKAIGNHQNYWTWGPRQDANSAGNQDEPRRSRPRPLD